MIIYLDQTLLTGSCGSLGSVNKDLAVSPGQFPDRLSPKGFARFR